MSRALMMKTNISLLFFHSEFYCMFSKCFRSFYRHHYDVILDQEIPYNAILSSSGLFKGC